MRQQGRVLLDSDWNEQSFIWAENFRQLARSIMGDFAIPLAANEITPDNSSAFKISRFSVGSGGVIDFRIGRGLAYIAGFPFTLSKDISFRSQLDLPEPQSPEIDNDIIIYIEVWQRSISYIDDDFIREQALGGPDSCTRIKLVGQVKAVSSAEIGSKSEAKKYLEDTLPKNDLLLTIKIDHSGRQIPLSFGEIDVSGGYSVPNLHLRIEIHKGLDANGGLSQGLKWSDENCATVVRILEAVNSSSLLIEEPEAVSGSFFQEGDRVEICNLVTELHRQGGQMARIAKMSHEAAGHVITLDSEIHPMLTRLRIGAKYGPKTDLAPRLRRWAGFVPHITVGKPYSLGKGIKGTFNSPEKKFTAIPGDYWTFAIRDREYNKKYSPQKAPPEGVRAYRYPLAIIKNSGKNKTGEIIDCREFFKPLSISSFRTTSTFKATTL